MTDGEIELQVNAEGVEDAAGELDGAEIGGGGDAGGGGGGLGGGRTLGILGAIVGLLSFLDPIVKILDVISQILTAFVAPVAIMLMRLLQPSLRLLLALLPLWIEFINLVSPIVSLIQSLTSMILSPIIKIVEIATDVLHGVNDFKDALLSQLEKDLRELPAKIGSAISGQLPGVSQTGAGVRSGVRGETGDEAEGNRAGRAVGTVVRISGGLTPFIDQIARENGIDGT